jgi:hypothetical protein
MSVTSLSPVAMRSTSAKGIERPNKELKLTKPSQDGASQLNSVFGRQ